MSLCSRVRNQEFVVRRRDSYYMHNGKQVRPKPYFKEVRVKVIEDLNTALLALKAGEIEELMLRAEQWANQTSGDDFYKHNTKVTAPEWTEFHFIWNMRTPYFSDKRVRAGDVVRVRLRRIFEQDLRTVCISHVEARFILRPGTFPRTDRSPTSKISIRRKTCSTQPAGPIAMATAFATRKSTAAAFRSSSR